MKKVKIIIRSILFAMALMSVIIAANYILSPKIPSFYKEKDYNVVFLARVNHIVPLIRRYLMNMV